MRRVEPFSHAVARDVFASSFYEELVRDFASVLARGLEHGLWDHERFNLVSSGHYSCLLTERTAHRSLRLFLSQSWHDLMQRIFRVRGNGEVSAALHYHLPGSKNGTPHNDLSPAWFPDGQHEGIVVADPAVCDYTTGNPAIEGVHTHESVRTAAVIFYLANGAWKESDGGGTGLYRGLHDDVSAPVARVLPHDNSLVAFACTPWSFHSFMTNPQRPRSSIVMWIHGPMQEAVARWGSRSIDRWRDRVKAPRQVKR